MSKRWMILDAFNNPQGPYTEREVCELVWTHGDLYVMSERMLHWQRASEIPDLGKGEPSQGPRLDGHGQPLDHRMNARRCADRDVQELLGLLKGVISDGVVSDSEVVALQEWVDSHPWAHHEWPVDVLVRRLRRILADGVIDDDERKDLLELLRQATGERPDASTAMNGATRLPVDQPIPTIIFPDRTFVFTGTFAFGTRRECEAAAAVRGAVVAPRVTKKTHFVVIGTIASAQWALSAYGRKIQKAVDIREKGAPLAIVGEEHWVTALTAAA